MLKNILFIFCFYACVFKASADTKVISYNSSDSLIKVGNHFEVLEDIHNKYNESSILSATAFEQNNKSIPVFPSGNINVWFRFSISNLTTNNTLYFYIQYFNISNIKLYKETNGKLAEIYVDGNAVKHAINNTLPDYLANLQLQPDSNATFYIHVESDHPLVLNAYTGSYGALLNQSNNQLIAVSIYLGILLVIFLYNLFLFFTTGDRNYLIYVLYIFFLGVAQYTLAGYMFKYFWLSYPAINYFAVPVTTSLAFIFGVLFSIKFLRTRHYTPFLHKVLWGTVLLNVASIIASILQLNNLSYLLIDINTIAVGLFTMTAAIIIVFKGYRPALYYAVSWLFFLAGLIIFSLRNFDVLPADSFTNYILYIGSAIEAVLLSIALADKINVLKKEKEQSQLEALRQARANEQLVSEQNVMLENKVAQRTSELQNANTQLNDALNNLKDTQTQLVEAEKMASLGQLTAGIAHEINNPINFVKSNINPLRLDVKDLVTVLNAYDELHEVNDQSMYKQKLKEIEEMKADIDIAFVQKEIDSLIVGIEDGAERTAEIVRGLRTFSRIDESALKTVNLHDGILSTIVLLKNNIPYNIKLVKEFNAEGEVECFPGKVNQVFMNILTNAAQSIKAKPQKNEEETITIKTRDVEGDRMEISIKDSGIGMTEEVKHKVFEPFFTTKDVGEGTGLGMAIVFKIIQKHSGTINIVSEPDKGAEFIITLPHKYQGSD